MQAKMNLLKDKLKEIRAYSQGVTRQRKILGVFLILFVGFLLYQSLISSQLARLKAVNTQWRSKKKLMVFYDRLMLNDTELINELKENENNINQLKEKFVAESDLTNYFGGLREQVKSQGLGILSLDFKARQPVSQYYQQIPFNISLKGDYYDLMSLLHNLGANKPIFEIKSVNLKRQDGQSYDLTMNMDAAIYILLGAGKN
jgi:Tfp pilus assembly protein PilO